MGEGEPGPLCQPPRLLRDWHQIRVDDGRTTSLQELFIDLIFASAIANLDAGLRGDDGQPRLLFGDYLLVFLTVFQLWVMMVEYATRFYTDDLVNKTWVAFYMLGVVGLTIHTRAPTSDVGNFRSFCCCAAWCCLLLAGAYARVGMALPRAKFTSTVVGSLSALVAAVFLCSFAVHTVDGARALLSVVVIILAFRPLIYIGVVPRGHGLPLHLPHWLDRYTCFVIIVLGEAVTGMSMDLRGTQPARLYAAVLFAFMVVLHAKYLLFDVDSRGLDDHALRRSRLCGVTWGFSFNGIIVSIAVTGCGLRVLLFEASDDPDLLQSAVHWLCYGLGAFYGLTAVVMLLHKPPAKRRGLFAAQALSSVAASVAVGTLPMTAGYERLGRHNALPVLGSLALLTAALAYFQLTDEVLEERERKLKRVDPLLSPAETPSAEETERAAS